MPESLKLSRKQIDRLRFVLADELGIPSDVVHHGLVRANENIDALDAHISSGKPAIFRALKKG